MDSSKVWEGIIIGFFGGLFAGLGIWLLDRIREKVNFSIDEAQIIKFLKSTLNETDKSFRTTHRIASEVNRTEARVREVCSNSKKIRRNQLAEEIWTLRPE